MGIPTPSDIGVTGESESVAAYQDQVVSKEETLTHLRWVEGTARRAAEHSIGAAVRRLPGPRP